MDNDTFVRILELESVKKQLKLYQKQVGGVDCVVWDAAIVLAKYLDVLCQVNRNGLNWLRGKQVLELGAGIGCVGMTASCFGAQVIMTDLKTALPMLEKNILLNKNVWENSGGFAEARILEWGEKINLNFDPDIILLADCVYYSESIQPLIQTLMHFCKNDGSNYAILSQEERDTPCQIAIWKEFIAEISKKFKLEYISRSEQHLIYFSDDIHLIKLTKL